MFEYFGTAGRAMFTMFELTLAMLSFIVCLEHCAGNFHWWLLDVLSSTAVGSLGFRRASGTAADSAAMM